MPDEPSPLEQPAAQPAKMVVDRRRVVVVTAVVAVGSLVLGMFLASRITSPDEAASRTRAPDASPITVPVERRQVRSEVVTRGDVVYDDATEVEVLTSGLEVPPVVTGNVLRVGDTIAAGAVVLQVVGRPVIALSGELPAYRTLSPGMTGPDVRQLEEALAALGLDPGNAGDDRYDGATAAAVGRLYERAGYTAPPEDPMISEELTGARDNATAAGESLTAAEQALAAASAPPAESARLEAEALVTTAQRALDEARASGDANAVATAESDLAIAQAQRDEALAPRSTTAEQAAVTDAREQRDAANAQLADVEARAGTPLPAAEVVFLPSLPRRVDEVAVERGQEVNGAVMQVSGAEIVVAVTLSGADAGLVRAGMTAQFQVGEETLEGTVQEVRNPSGSGSEESESESGSGEGAEEGSGDGSGEGEGEGDGGGGAGARREAIIAPGELTPAQVEAIRGTNVRVTIPVQSTSGEVLAVPLAALSAGPGGESRVEVQRDDGEVERVVVEVGLSAGGYAEVRPTEGRLEEGDLVVVGRE